MCKQCYIAFAKDQNVYFWIWFAETLLSGQILFLGVVFSLPLWAQVCLQVPFYLVLYPGTWALFCLAESMEKGFKDDKYSARAGWADFVHRNWTIPRHNWRQRMKTWWRRSVY
jgi:hypothetical protein